MNIEIEDQTLDLEKGDLFYIDSRTLFPSRSFAILEYVGSFYDTDNDLHYVFKRESDVWTVMPHQDAVEFLKSNNIEFMRRIES